MIHYYQDRKMLIGGVLSASNWISQLGQLSSTSQTNGTRANRGVDEIPSPGPSAGGGMLEAITQALAKIGVGNSASASSKTAATSASASSSSSTSAAEDPARALAAFMQTLMAALHSQSTQAATNDSSIAGSSGQHRHNFQSDMQSLIEKLASSSGNSTGSGSSDSSVGALQQSFQKLLGAVGGSSSKATLADFLQAFASNMPAASSVGNVVSTRV
jgi:hypothetical protein